MPDALSDLSSWGPLAAMLMVIAVSGYLGLMAERAVSRGSSFIKGYFLGNRGLGVWAMALTATVQSGGTFMGFPSLVYSYGWIVALWIASYMLVPLVSFALLGKRLAHISRRTDAVTVPDLFRGRFNSPSVGLIASLLILFLMASMMVAQFKAGAIVMKLCWPGNADLVLTEDAAASGLDTAYYIGLVVFACTVVGYTLLGGFLASVWADLFQSVLMLLGVVMLVLLAVPAAGGLEQATLAAVENTSSDFAFGPGYSPDGREFLPVGLAFSFFFVWVFGNAAAPAGMVRVMAAKDTSTLRRSIVVLALYNSVIYLPLVVICIAARAIMPSLASSDEVIPRMALHTTSSLPGGSLLGGLILAAPFGAVMATVSTYLVIIASGLVRDVYQRFIHPEASATEIRRLTYVAMTLVGTLAVVANLKPVQYLQAIVIFCGSAGAATFLMPGIMACYWRRATAVAAAAAMLTGFGIVAGLFVLGFVSEDQMIGQASAFQPYYLLGLHPVVWGLAGSIVVGIVVSLITRPPDDDWVANLFDVQH